MRREDHRQAGCKSSDAVCGVSTRLRITFVLSGRGLSGGVRVVVAHGNQLIDRGHQVTMVCLRQRWPRRPGRVLRRLYRGIRTASGVNRDHLHDFRGRLLLIPAERLADKLPAGDVVVATHWLTAQPVAGLPEAKGAKYYFIQGYEVHAFKPSDIESTWHLPMRKLVVSKWLRDLLEQKAGDSTAVVIPNGVDPARFDAPARGPHRPPTVGVTYSPVPAKGSAVAFAAIRLARRKLPDLAVVCFGAVPPAAASLLPAKSRFHLRPPQDQLRAIYASADVWLCASEREGFGLPSLEAMACRCPVVVTRCGGPSDFVEDGRNGYFVDVGDAEAMAERIVMIVSDKTRWKRMSDAAYETRERFSLERSAAMFERALLEAKAACGGGEGLTGSGAVASWSDRLDGSDRV